MQAFFQELINNIQHFTWLEAVAVVFGIISVLCSKQNSVWVYPTGLVSTGIFAYMLALDSFKLYGEAVLNVYYFVMSVYGWYYWSKKDATQHHVAISYTNKRELSTAIGISVIGWGVFYYLLKNYSQSDVPIFDGFVSATACAGMWLLAKRKIENWIFLNISNFVAVPLLFHKHLVLTALLTIFLFIIAVTGYFKWVKLYKTQQSAS
ncbi:nicotinamide mononucleotide transporter [Chitinophaga skermanii]|uniref:Nicotinamide riboside transporter PnuC n=1 Tax=Chitinophaga skermanii TaxID=331697 RepID=A0A327Q4N1_9BACT|nr:nicotinamide riboside transporter PnuC [Chitinophaga skermanii]RAI98691.1 nicotinamide mononucleotide transporter [Chitinophaga skermanii]